MQLCLFNQRWRERRESYRPAGEPINPGHYEVARLAAGREAKEFILRHHYLGSYPSARFRFGLFTKGELVGVAVFSHPSNDRVLTSVFPLSPIETVELGRFVLLDSVPANGESWFLARAFECLRKDGLAGVVTGALYGAIRHSSGSAAPAAMAHAVYNLTLYAVSVAVKLLGETL